MFDNALVWMATRDWDFRIAGFRVGRWLSGELFSIAIRF